MHPDKQSYQIHWQQVYPYWEDMQQQLTEMKVENSDMCEAKVVIEHIMSL